ncbi:peptide ligase PGM1-related protein [Streptomyces sp. NPDC048664]|uniref:preATP grasp domain-containing protein n=1 Tax=Streptomyces sp. NPDC048664 TaxID=3154505 RepID=UPI0034163DAC
MKRDYPLVIFGNFINELMVTVPAPRHGDALVAVSPRKIWLTRPGDVLVIPTAMSQPLCAYACGLLGFDPADVPVVSAPTGELATLTEAVRRNGLVDRIRSLAAERPDAHLQAFAQDRPALAMAAELGLPIEGYGPDGVPASARDAVYRINTKDGFRSVATELGIRIAEGHTCRTPDDLAAAVRRTLTDHGGAVVKPARGSNGYGVLFLSEKDLPEIDERLAAYLPTVAEQPPGWVVEERLDFARVVTVEMAVDETGPSILHVGEMRTPGGSFSGQITPLVASSSAVEELKAGGMALGRYLYRAGYRGPFDIDGGIADDVLYATESNVRKTGATYLDLLVRRLLGEERAAGAVWLADSRPGGVEAEFDAGLARVRAAGLAFEADGTEGVVLTSDTLAFDGKWRYLVLAESHRRAEEIEAGLADTLKLA